MIEFRINEHITQHIGSMRIVIVYICEILDVHE